MTGSAKYRLSGFVNISGKNGYIFFICLVFFIIIPRFITLNIPFERDEGAYAYISDSIDRGWLPYKDAFDHKPPGIYYLYNVSFKLFGHNVSAPRITGLIFIITSCVIIFYFVMRVTSQFKQGLFASLLLGVSSFSHAYAGFTANTELFTTPFILLGVTLLMFQPFRFLLTYSLAGLAFGIGFIIKQPVAVIAAAVFIPSLFRGVRDIKQALSVSIYYWVSFILPTFLFGLYFYLNGGGTEFWEGFYTYNMGYVSALQGNYKEIVFYHNMKNIFVNDPIIWITGMVGLGVSIIGLKSWRDKLFITFFLAGSIGAISLGGRFLNHYFIFAIAALALCAALGYFVVEQAKFRKAANIAYFIIALWSLIFCLHSASHSYRDILDRTYGEDTSSKFIQSMQVGDYLKKSAGDNKTAYVIGAEPEILFYGGMSSPTRIISFYHVMQRTMLRDKFREEVISALMNNKPDYLIVTEYVKLFSAFYFKEELPDNPFLYEVFKLFSEYKLMAYSLSVDGGVIEYSNDILGADKIEKSHSAIFILKKNET